MDDNQSTQIPPPGVVRFIGVVLLVIDIVTLIVAIAYFQTLGTLFASTLIIGAIGTIFLPIKAIQTGKPEWVLLDLILPQ